MSAALPAVKRFAYAKLAVAFCALLFLTIVGARAGPPIHVASASVTMPPSASAPGVAAAAFIAAASSTPAEPRAPPLSDPSAAAQLGASGQLADGRIALNTAREDDLVRLPGIGAKRAQSILALRQRLGGRFRALGDLLRVKGLGRKTLERLRPLLVLDAPAAPGGA